MSPLAENNGGLGEHQGFDNQSKKAVLKDETMAKSLVVSSYIPTLKHEVEQQLLTQKRLFQLLRKQTNSHFWLTSSCLTLCFSVGTQKDTTEHLVIISSVDNLFLVVEALDMPLPLRCFQR